MIATSSSLADMLQRRPDHIWIDSNIALFGWGERARIDVGTGPERYERALTVLEADQEARAFASFTFDPEEPGSVVVVPETLVAIVGDQTRILLGDDLPERQPWRDLPPLAATRDDGSSWAGSFGRAMDALANDEVEKVVLSRSITFTVEGALPLEVVAANLGRTQPGSTVFVVERLIGSSPELLASLADGRVTSLCLAGSSAVDDPTSLAKDKAVREHEFAADSVGDALTPHCVSITRGERHRVDFAGISHLATRFDGEVRRGTSVLDVVRDLHPTAAVAGTPTKAALELIREIEGDRRGRYAGPVGWFDHEGSGTFAIALRCGLAGEGEITLFAGAGLVAGSDEMAELAETELKLGPMLGGLGA